MSSNARSAVVSVVGVVGLLALTACGTSAKDSVVPGPRPTATDVKVKPYKRVVPATTSVTTPKVPAASGSAAPDALGDASGSYSCPSFDSRFSACWVVTNDGQTFSSANALGVEPFTTNLFSLSHGCTANAPPNPLMAGGPLHTPATPGGKRAIAAAESCGEGVEGHFNVFPPTQTQDTGAPQLHVDVPIDGSNSASCSNTTYTSCVVTQQTGDYHPSTYFTVKNYPVTVAITNNLPSANNDSLSLVGQVETTGLVLDPTGTSSNASTIPGGQTAYYGLYGAIVPSSNPIEGVQMTYQVPSTSTDLAGSQFELNLMIDPSTGAYPTSAVLKENQTTCTFLPGATTQSATCTVGPLQGPPGGPQTIPIDIHE